MKADECYEISLIERLLSGKEIIESKKSDVLLRRFYVAGWISVSRRNKGWQRSPESREPLIDRLQQLWPTREDDLPLLKSAGLSTENSSALLHLPSLRRKLSSVSGFVNNHTWSTLFGSGPKKSAWRDPGNDVVLTQDTVSRIRPNKGLELKCGRTILNLSDLASVLTEISISQRAILSGAVFAGVLPKAVITVENLGAFTDCPLPDDVMLIYSPGFDTKAAEQILRQLPDVPWMHFGDLDPEGLQIWDVLQKAVGRPCLLFVPSFSEEYFDMAQKPDVPWLETPNLPVFELLKQSGRGIFQEVFLLDKRLKNDLHSALTPYPSSDFFQL